MKWVPFIILGVITLVCQTTISGIIAIHSIWPNWLFVLAVHYALWGPWPEAAIGAWLLGLAVDLQTLAGFGSMGVYAFLFGGAAWAIIRIRSALVREHALTQFLVTLVFAWAIELLSELHRQWRTPAEMLSVAVWWPAFFTALYTAACAPYLHWLLIRLGRWTGLRPARRL